MKEVGIPTLRRDYRHISTEQSYPLAGYFLFSLAEYPAACCEDFYLFGGFNRNAFLFDK